MRKISISLSTLMVLFVLYAVLACEKAIVIDSDEMTGDPDGNVRVSVYQVAMTPFESLTRRAGSEASSVMTRLNFAVYTPDGERVKQVNQTSDKEGFGVASFLLEPGDYQLVVVGHSSDGNPTMTDPSCIKFTNAQGFTETFKDYRMLTVTDDNQDVPSSLERIVSLCRFCITDDFPAEVTKLRFYYTGGSGAFEAPTGFGCVNSKQDVKFDVTSGQKQFDLYTFLHDQEGTIHLQVTALDASGNVLKERTFDVPMQRNHVTWLTGAFFNGSSASSSATITVTVNTTWGGESHLTF
jgi:hypothetical protein